MNRGVGGAGMTQFAWHVHHDVWLEPLTEPIRRRRDYIRKWKPPREVALRLRLLKPVKGKLPAAVVKAGAAYIKTGVAAEKAWDAYADATDKTLRRAAYFATAGAYDQAGTALREALTDHRAEIEVLHKRECPRCPWDGETIFPRRKKR